MMKQYKRELLTACLLLLCAVPVSASAQTPSPDSATVEGVVARVEGGEIIVDLGSSSGLPDDATVRVYRKVQVTHPVTNEQVADRFAIGKMRLAKVGERLSIASQIESLERPPSVGDFVVWSPSEATRRARAPADTAGGDSAQHVCPPADDPEVAAVDQAFEQTLGRPLSERIEIWERFLKEHTDNRYAEDVGVELAWLRDRLKAAREQQQALAEMDRQSQPEALSARVSVASRVGPGEPVEVVATFEQPERIEQVRLLTKRPDQVSFNERTMERAGDRNWRVRLDEQADNPGEVSYFVEAVRTDGELELVAANAEFPRTLVVERPADDPELEQNRSRATGIVEHVNFKSGEGDDHYWRFETDYRYGIGMGMIDALKVGVGIFDGRGGSVEAIERGDDAQDLSVSYGFAELQLAVTEFIGISGRLLVGDRQSTTSSSLEDTFGVRSELRIGARDDTRLQLGLSHTDGIGNEVWIQLAVDEIHRIPMSGEVVVTNLPVGADLGVMLNYGTGYQFTDWFSVMARVGWNARTIRYQGPTVGLGTVIDW